MTDLARNAHTVAARMTDPGADAAPHAAGCVVADEPRRGLEIAP